MKNFFQHITLSVAMVIMATFSAFAVEVAVSNDHVQNQILANKLEALEEQFNKMSFCQNQKMLYAPADPTASTNGCIPTSNVLEELEVEVITNKICTRNTTSETTMSATCSSEYRLLACSGGPGDLNDGSDENFRITPNPSLNRCDFIAYETKCDSSLDRESAFVHATCYKTGVPFTPPPPPPPPPVGCLVDPSPSFPDGIPAGCDPTIPAAPLF